MNSINDDMPCFGVPIDVRVSRGRLRCVPPYADQELEFSQVEGRLMSVSKTKWHGFPYWCVCLHDGVNEYHVLFFLKSAMFVYLLRCLSGQRVINLSIQVGKLSDGAVHPKFDSTIIFGVQGMFNPKGFLLLCINYGGLQ